MDCLAIKARNPPVDPTAGYAGVICMNPVCGAPMDVFGVWPNVSGTHGPTAILRVIVTLQCPHCEQRSTYCARDVSYFQTQTRADWR